MNTGGQGSGEIAKTCRVKVQDPNDECKCIVYLKCTKILNGRKKGEEMGRKRTDCPSTVAGDKVAWPQSP